MQPTRPNQVWSLDFMAHSLWDGKKYRILNILDDFNREVLAIDTDTSIPALRVIRVLEQLKDSRGLPEMIRVDNGPEFISQKLDYWCKDNQVQLFFIQPGKPTQNGYVERLNGSMRKELLNAYVFRSLSEVREKGPGMDGAITIRPASQGPGHNLTRVLDQFILSENSNFGWPDFKGS